MHKLWQWIKAHPLEGGVLIGLVLLVVYVLFSSLSGSSSSSNTTTSDGTPLALAELQEQDSATEAGQQAQLQATQSTNSAQVSIAALGAQTQQNADTLSAQTTQQGNTLQAGVDTAQIQAQQEESDTQTNALLQIALAPYQVEEDQLNSSANSTISSLEGEVTSLSSAINLAGYTLSHGNGGMTSIDNAYGTLTSTGKVVA